MSDDEMKDVRWKQRFQNFEKAFKLLKQTIDIDSPSDAERAGLIQFFEITFELAWKLLKDYQEEVGFIIKSPREAIKQSFQTGLIKDGHTWIDALKDRNLTVHIYEEKIAVEVENKIRASYFPILAQLHDCFKQMANE